MLAVGIGRYDAGQTRMLDQRVVHPRLERRPFPQIHSMADDLHPGKFLKKVENPRIFRPASVVNHDDAGEPGFGERPDDFYESRPGPVRRYQKRNGNSRNFRANPSRQGRKALDLHKT